MCTRCPGYFGSFTPTAVLSSGFPSFRGMKLSVCYSATEPPPGAAVSSLAASVSPASTPLLRSQHGMPTLASFSSFATSARVRDALPTGVRPLPLVSLVVGCCPPQVAPAERALTCLLFPGSFMSYTDRRLPCRSAPPP